MRPGSEPPKVLRWSADYGTKPREDALEAERALADDLYAALDGFWGIGFQHNNDDHPDVVAVLARYREARGRVVDPDAEILAAARESNRKFARAQEQRLLDEMRSPDA